jgi:hypothetical protein
VNQKGNTTGESKESTEVKRKAKANSVQLFFVEVDDHYAEDSEEAGTYTADTALLQLYEDSLERSEGRQC